MLKKRIMVIGRGNRYKQHIDPLRSMARTCGSLRLEEFSDLQEGVDALEQACATSPPDLVIIFAGFAYSGYSLALMDLANKYKVPFGLFWDREKELLGPGYLFEYCAFHFRTDVPGQGLCTKVTQILSDKK